MPNKLDQFSKELNEDVLEFTKYKYGNLFFLWNQISIRRNTFKQFRFYSGRRKNVQEQNVKCYVGF